MWAVDRLICECNFQQICNFLICANLQFRKCKFAFFACKLVKIRECTLDILPNLFTLPMPMQEEQRWTHHLTYLPRSQAVMLMAREQCYDVAPHWSPHRRECRDSGKCRILLPDQSGGERQMMEKLRSALAEDSGPVAGSVSGRVLRYRLASWIFLTVASSMVTEVGGGFYLRCFEVGKGPFGIFGCQEPFLRLLLCYCIY